MVLRRVADGRLLFRVTARGHRAALRQLRGVTDALTNNDPIAIFKSLGSAGPSQDTTGDDGSDGDDLLRLVHARDHAREHWRI